MVITWYWLSSTSAKELQKHLNLICPTISWLILFLPYLHIDLVGSHQRREVSGEDGEDQD